MTDSTYHAPQAVARELAVSPATLRRWSDEFADYLSGGAASAQGRSHRRYTDGDVALLAAVKELMANGLTYEQVRQQLARQAAHKFTPPEPASLSSPAGLEKDTFSHQPSPPHGDEMALVAPDGPESAAIAFLTNTLRVLSEGQKSILNSQAATREVMGVLIQDNFNLKEENQRLRERILELERSAAQARREEEWRREAIRQELDAKIATVQQLASEALTVAHSVEMPEIKAINTKPGCLGALLGGGGLRLVPVPRRRSREGQGGYAGSFPPAAPGQPQASIPPQRQPMVHPKPTTPPE